MKQQLSIFKPFFAILVALFFLSSCGNDDDAIIEPIAPVDPEPEPAAKVSKYVVGFEALPVGGEQPVDFVLDMAALSDLESGEISVEGQGLPQKGWRYFHQAGASLLSVGFAADDQGLVYQLDAEGALKSVNNFTLTNNFDKRFLNINDDTLVIVDLIARGVFDGDIPDLEFTVVDTKTGKVTGKFSHPIDHKSDGELFENYVPHINGMAFRDSKLFISYHKLDTQGGFNLIDGNKAYIAVLNYPDFTLDQLIEDDRTNVIGVDGHYGLFKDNAGTVYSYSAGSKAAGLIQETQNTSGLLRIKKGTTDFDPDYFFDVENAINGGKLFWADYIGNGKALARVLAQEGLPDWAAFAEQGPFFRLVILDLEAQTVTTVQGMPLHANRYTAPLFVENGKAYISARTGNPIGLGETSVADGESYVYRIDPATATASKGAKIKGLSLKGIFKISN